MGLNIVLAGFFWVGLSLDFFSILLTGNNLPNSGGWMGIIIFMWAPLVLLISLYIGAELMIPSKKKYIVALFLILTIIFELFLFIFPLDMFTIVDPIPPGSGLISIYIEKNSPVNLLMVLFQLMGFFFCGFGYLVKSLKSSGVIKNKFLLLSIGYLVYAGIPIFAALMTFYSIDFPVAPLFRLIVASSFLFFYFGLKEAPTEKKKKEHYVREIKIEEF